MKQTNKLYKIDTKGKTRVWFIEYTDKQYRTVSGVLDGKLVISTWKDVEQKNLGKSNETSLSEQVVKEVESLVKKKKEIELYAENLTEENDKSFFKPMLAHVFNKETIAFPVIVQPKLDGIRCIATKDGLFSRNGKRFVSVPHIENALKPLFQNYPLMVIDGELYNHSLKDNFEEIVSLTKKTKPTQEDLDKSEKIIQYHVFDCHSSDNSLFFIGRYNLIIGMLSLLKRPDIFVPVDRYFVNDMESLDFIHNKIALDGYEGSMIRINDSKYENKRSKNLLKRKDFIDEEFIVNDILEGKGNWSGAAKAIQLRLNDKIFEAGLAASYEKAQEILQNKDAYINGIATVKYQNLTTDGVPRFGVVKHIYKNNEVKN